jgi:hypothetical protein
MKKTYVFALFFFVCLTSFAQQPADTISIKKVYDVYEFRQGTELLKRKQLVGILKSNDEAFKKIKLARTNAQFSAVLSATGGFLIGYSLSAVIIGEKPIWLIAGVGAGLIVIAIPINRKGNKHLIKAVEIYNNSLLASSSKSKNEFFLTFSENGLGLKFRF